MIHTARRLSISVLLGLLVCVPEAAFARTVAVGLSHMVVAKPDGTVWAWGENGNGQLGTGDTANRAVPTQVAGLVDIVAVAAGASHTLALDSAGTVWAWGYGRPVGSGTTGLQSTPIALTLTNIVAIAAGSGHSVALQSDGTVWTWGANADGQLGNGTSSSSSLPAPLSSISSVSAIASGSTFTLAVKADGTTWGWGTNSSGQLGDGSTTERTAPVQMTGVTTAVAVAAGDAHALVLLGDGTVRAIGANANGQLGDGTTLPRSSLVTVTGLTGVTSLAADSSTSGARRADGTVVLWGFNGSGQLGDGTTTTRSTPVAPVGLPAGMSLLATGASQTIAVSSTGIVFTWGGNASGQLGDGTVASRLTPLAISGPAYDWNVGTPTFSHSTGTYSAAFTVTVTAATPGAEIHYTLTGDEPTESDPTIASGGTLLIDRVQTLTARAWKAGMPTSRIASATYTLKAAAPTFSPIATTYTSPQTVSMTTSTTGATIRYTLDGSDPVESSPVYAAPLGVNTTTTIKAAAFKTDWVSSTVATGAYVMSFGQAASPVASPSPGSYISSVVVTLSAIPGATIYYTTDGSTPSTSSAVYTVPLTLVATTTVRARVTHPDYSTSAVTTAAYTIVAAAPTLAPVAGTYAAGQAITISCATPGATITYTLNGAEPTATDPSIPSGGTLVAGNFTVKVKAWKSGATASPTTTAAYAVTGSVATPSIAAGDQHSLAVRGDGTAWAWGDNASGQLADGTTTARSLPTPVAGMTGLAATDGGASHTLFVRTSGAAAAAGLNSSGQLGDTSTTRRTLAVPVSTSALLASVSAGASHSLAVTADRLVLAWGGNDFQQLGDGTTTPRATPAPVAGLTGMTSVAAGESFSVALKSDGTVWTWGSNAVGQLGDGSTTSRGTPAQVSIPATIVAIAAGQRFVLALANNGAVWAWGVNNDGQLGDGSGTTQKSPVPTTGLSSPIVAIAAGTRHSLAIATDGTLLTWGANSTGQLGDGSTSNRDTPGALTGIPPIVAVAGGSGHSLALGSNGSVWAWGANNKGQLGDGTLQTRLVPTSISDASMAWRVATPNLSEAPGTYTSTLNVVVTVLTPGATIHYSTNGAEPTETDPTLVSGGSLSITQTTTLKVKAWKAGQPPSSTGVALYTLKVPTPTLSVTSGTYATPQSVTVSSAVSGVVLHYTTNGLEPTEADPIVASGASILVDQPVTLKARGWRTGWTAGDVVTRTYSFKVGMPVLNPAAGSYGASQVLTVTTVTPGAVIHITTNGLEPTTSDLALASGGSVTVAASSTIRAKGFKAGWEASDTNRSTYWLTLGTVAAPTFTPAGGTYTSTQVVSIGTTSAGATIRYTLDGTEPTLVSRLYDGPIRMASDGTLRARAFKADWQPSVTSDATYIIDLGTVSTPRLSPQGGPLTNARVVTVSSSTVGATIHYTTDGRDPTESDPVVASGATVLVDRAMRLKAKAWKSGTPASDVATADYWFTGGVAAGESHTLVLMAGGQVMAFGRNVDGQLGDGTFQSRTSPAPVTGLTDVVAIAAGARHSLALKRSGAVYAWGVNSSGQLGDGTQTSRAAPVAVTGLSDIIAISAGESHSLALRRDGTVWGWGANGHFQLGIGTGSTSPRLTPVQTANLTNVVAIGAGGYSSFALRGDGVAGATVWAWGNNADGQMADGTSNGRGAAEQGLPDIASLGIGSQHAVWVAASGDVLAAGINSHGQLGDGTLTPRLLPTASRIATPMAAAASGREHTLLLAQDGTVWAAGNNTFGQVGDSTQTGWGGPMPVPVRLAGLGTEVIAVAAGRSHSVALTREGLVYVWGRNTDGQLGDGTTTMRKEPVRLASFSTLDNTWLRADPDGDGLATWRELELGTDIHRPDSNGDGVPDGIAINSGVDPLAADTDGDGVPNATEVLNQTDPLIADTDRDGVADGVDAFPLDPLRWQPLTPVPGDTTPPVITLIYPTNAVPVPPL